ncbi:uncharacterized protein AAES06_016017 isoform 3-T4 [Glossophaga mutica]
MSSQQLSEIPASQPMTLGQCCWPFTYLVRGVLRPVNSLHLQLRPCSAGGAPTQTRRKVLLPTTEAEILPHPPSPCPWQPKLHQWEFLTLKRIPGVLLSVLLIWHLIVH